MVIADYYLATFLTQPSWIEDIRPFRAVMMPLDLPAQKSDIDRFTPPAGRGKPWIENARKQYVFDMASALKGALRDLKLDRAKVAFDDQGFGLRLGMEGLRVADGYDPIYVLSGARPASMSGHPQDRRLAKISLGTKIVPRSLRDSACTPSLCHVFLK